MSRGERRGRAGAALRVLAAVVAPLITATGPGVAEDPPGPAAVATTPYFVFYSELATNVHDALLEAGRDRNRGESELFAAGEEATCFERLATSARTAWNLAVDYYAQVVSPRKWSDRQQVLIRLDLARVEEIEEESARRYVGITRGFIEAATPAYEACRWKLQDAGNRRWIQSLRAQLELHEETIAGKLAELYGKPLGGLPIRVDVVETVNWSGATTWLLDPDGGHIVISNVEAGPVSLEYLFHEASHTLMRRDDPVRLALKRAAERLDLPLPDDLWHAVLFFTTGDAVRRVLAGAGEPDYTPLLFAGGIFGRHHDAMRAAWTAYLDGEIELRVAAEKLVAALSLRAPPSSSAR